MNTVGVSNSSPQQNFNVFEILLQTQAHEVAPSPPPPAEGELVGRGRQKGAPGAIAREGEIKLVDAGNRGLKCKKHMGVLTLTHL